MAVSVLVAHRRHTKKVYKLPPPRKNWESRGELCLNSLNSDAKSRRVVGTSHFRQRSIYFETSYAFK